MYNSRSHPLLAQVPLTFSPFISLLTPSTLPYTYQSLPSKLPSSSTTDSAGTEREKYVVSPSGHAASPEDIIASCQELQKQIQKTKEDAEQTIKDWEKSLREQELAEKRRVAPGWLDREEKILEPKRGNTGGSATPSIAQIQSASIMDQQDEKPQGSSRTTTGADPGGDELDRAFGGLGLRNG